MTFHPSPITRIPSLVSEQLEAFRLLVDISRFLTPELNDKEIAETLLKIFLKIMAIKKAGFFFLNEEKQRYDFYSGPESTASDFESLQLKENEAFPEWLKNRKALIFRDDLQDDPEHRISLFLHGAKLHCCIPFITNEKLIGFVFLGLAGDISHFLESERQLLFLIGEQIAIAIENTRLAQALKKSKVLVRRTDRLKSLETIAGGMAHEIRNPLTSIKTFVELAGERRDDDDFFENFAKVAREDIERIERIIREVLDYSRYMEPVFTKEDLNEVIQSTLPFMVIEANKRGAKFQTEYQDNLPRLVMDRQQIKQVLLNLFINAIDALPSSNGIIKVKTSGLMKNEIFWGQIQIEDNGIGIPPENLENIFDPFFTTKHESKEREGTGLGLAIVYQIIQDHRGEIEVKSTPQVGTVFVVNLPSNPLLYERRRTKHF